MAIDEQNYLHMRKLSVFTLLLFIVFSVSAGKQYSYTTVPNDPFNVRTYTLDNGLKVFMTVKKGAPRIQTCIAVRVGSKNDPKETTGLAHYFEHMMFKGTSNFGTSNWEQEKILIDAIEQQFEVYRELIDTAQRSAVYRVIDSLSYEASKFAIPNEYDKLMSAIGSTGTNAGTSWDYTNYTENIPANELENWAKIQSDRFGDNVLRLFHTEIETVYEEKNMSLTNDSRRSMEATMFALFPNHPYGQQTNLGSQEHLKNPSMKTIREFFYKHYVPNNMAIVLAGDFDPDEAIKIVDKYFSKLQRKEDIKFTFEPEAPITAPIVREIVGLEAENISIAYRSAGAGSKDELICDMLSSMLYNGKAGLMDLNINQKQLVLRSYAYSMALNDHGVFLLAGTPKQGQTLDQVKDLLLAQLDLIKKGEFPDWMLEATINNLKYEMEKASESLRGRGMIITYAYLNNVDWAKRCRYVEDLSKVTKQDIIDFANANFNDNYVVVYKKQGKPADIAKVQKPAITPIEVNRDIESSYFKEIKENLGSPIAPDFVDYKAAISHAMINKNVPLLYTQNKENNTFDMIYLFEMGSYNDKKLSLAFTYLDFLGTSKYTPVQIKQEFYKIACNFTVSTSSERTYVRISGLSENMNKAIVLAESLFADCQPNDEALKNVVSDILKKRIDAKANQQSNAQALFSYATYGPQSPTTNILSEEELNAITSAELISMIKGLNKYEHEILYYGPASLAEMRKILGKHHKTPKTLLPVPKAIEFIPLATTENRLVFAQYDAKQSYCYEIFKGVPFSKDLVPVINLYNSYFGGGMNAIVFQEMREKRSLAYTAWAEYSAPSAPEGYYVNRAFIATQNDKVVDAFNAFDDLYKEMPQSENAFKLVKESMLSDYRTLRVQKMNLIWNYLYQRRFGYTSNPEKMEFEAISKMTLKDIIDFQNQYIKDKPKTYVILGNEADFDFKVLEEKFGKVQKVSQEEIFGF